MADLRPTPPTDHGGPNTGRDGASAKTLRDNPGMWLLVRTTTTRDRAQGAAHRIRSGQLKAFPRGFLAQAVTTAAGSHEVWATYRPGLAARDDTA